MAEVPFAENGGCVALLFADFGQSDFVFMETVFGTRSQCPQDPQPYVVAPGEQSSAAS